MGFHYSGLSLCSSFLSCMRTTPPRKPVFPRRKQRISKTVRRSKVAKKDRGWKTMSRNQEKAASMLNRYVMSQKKQKSDQQSLRVARRPPPSAVANVSKALYFRRMVAKEMSIKVLRIQDMTLSVSEIQQLNDDVNLLFAELRAFERRIGELGGTVDSAKDAEKDEDIVTGSKGERLWGAAKTMLRKKARSDDQEDGAGTHGSTVAAAIVESGSEDSDADEADGHEAHLGSSADDGDDDGGGGGAHGDSEKMNVEKTRKRKRKGIDYESLKNMLSMTYYGWDELNNAELHDAERQATAVKIDRSGSAGTLAWATYVPTTEEVNQAILKRRKELVLAKFASQ
eukprot:ANDGO_03324.mRNA.1 Pre-mRNA-splicing factor ISY1 homolog